ncbi:hypothetical protein ACWEO4_04730 [Streptomyces sp. NPDC004393]|uniref:hypothetical protein n=1 Tax=Streptomyces sp. NPDC004533 TaxID=3154278 RepID=UPI0033A3EC4A
MTVDSAQAGRRGITRLLAVCAVLFGLFLMHGAPTTAAEGCHGAMPAMAASPPTGGHDPAAMTTAVPPAHGSAPAVRAADTSGMPGMLCVSTPAQERTPLPAPGLLAVAGAGGLALWTPARLRAAAAGTGRRGPPDCGRDLLLQVCIART